jgi:hypothetical protein
MEGMEGREGGKKGRKEGKKTHKRLHMAHKSSNLYCLYLYISVSVCLALGWDFFLGSLREGTDLLDHDGEGAQHLESSGKIHDIAPAQHQGQGHGYHLPLCIGEPHHHGHQHQEGIGDTGERIGSQ